MDSETASEMKKLWDQIEKYFVVAAAEEVTEEGKETVWVLRAK